MSEPQSKLRVLVVDDSAFMRRAIRSMVEAAPDMEVVAQANNGLEAVELAEKLKPDAVTLDIEMPQMDGLTALRHIKRVSEAAVLMVSSLTTKGSAAALTALRNGADDFIAKEVSQISLSVVKIQDELQQKLRAITSRKRTPSAFKPPLLNANLTAIPVIRPSEIDVVLIGSSTGGPPVLETIISALPQGLSVPVVVAQHMPRLFTQTMSERLDSVSEATVVHGEQGLILEKGHVYIAPGEVHTRLRNAGTGRYRLEVSEFPHEAVYRPSVNELFASGAKTCGKRVLAVVLTGMGDDGLVGGRELYRLGARILAQDSESCVVYGMPKAVTEAGLIAASLKPAQIASVLGKLTTVFPIAAASE